LELEAASSGKGAIEEVSKLQLSVKKIRTDHIAQMLVTRSKTTIGGTDCFFMSAKGL
jgi:hypothetical protein